MTQASSCVHPWFLLQDRSPLYRITKLMQSGHCVQVQDTILPAIFGTFYAMLVVLALLATVLLAVERPGWGGAFLLLLWVWLIIMMLAGPGVACSPLLASTAGRLQPCITPLHL